MNTLIRAFLVIAVAAVITTDALARGSTTSSSHSSSSVHSYGPSTTSKGTGYVNPNGHSVSGYTRKDGTVIAPYHATNPNSTKSDNYSTKGNTNPWTGKPGTK